MTTGQTAYKLIRYRPGLFLATVFFRGLDDLEPFFTGLVMKAFFDALSGDAEAHVFFEGPNEGDALDNNPADGFDEVQTELVSMNLSHTNGLTLRLNSAMPSLGAITELTNPQPGTLDLAPFDPARFSK